MRNVTLDEKVGEGAYGHVYLGAVDGSGKIYAVKKVDRDLILVTLAELAVLCSFRHPNILSCVFTPIIDGNSVRMVTPLALGDLSRSDVLAEKNIKQLVKWTSQICQAVAALHAHNIIHGDIKPANILRYANDHVKLCDFSMSVQIPTPGTTYKHTVMTITHRSIEVFMATTFPDEFSWGMPVDIWALGCTLYEIGYGVLLFPFQKSNTRDGRDGMCVAKTLRALLHWQAMQKDPCDNHLVKRCQDVLMNTDDEFKRPVPHRLFEQRTGRLGEFNDLLLKMLQLDPIHRIQSRQLRAFSFIRSTAEPSYSAISVRTHDISQETHTDLMQLAHENNVSYPMLAALYSKLIKRSMSHADRSRAALLVVSSLTKQKVVTSMNDLPLVESVLEYLHFRVLHIADS